MSTSIPSSTAGREAETMSTRPKASSRACPGPREPRLGLACLVVAAALLALPAAAAQYEQVVVLQPGWNAVYLQVQPDPDDIETALAGIPVASVWTYNPDTSPVQFIQDPGEGLLSVSGWWGYFPRPRPEAFLSNLFSLQANRAYLINLDGSDPVTWRVHGSPVLRRQTWVSDSFNLLGLAVDPDHPATFGAYFANSPAHDGQPIFRLGSNGTWTRIQQPYSATIEPGVAYWVYCAGTSSYQGPLEVQSDALGGLEFASGLTTQTLSLRNHSAVDVDVTLRLLSATTPVPLALQVTDDSTGESSWPTLPSTYTVPVGAGEEVILNVGVRRAAFTSNRVEQVLEITDGLGSRRLVAVGATAIQAPAGTATKAGLGRAAVAAGEPLSGLWIGTADIDAVSNAQTGGTTPLPVGKHFELRVLIHVDAGGRARLLKQAIQMWQNGTLAPSPDDPTYLTTETPGRYVLLTDDSLIPDFTGATVRDGVPVGIRVSTIDYDFAGNELDLDGVFDMTGSLHGTIVIPSEFPTNPFLHRYHPDHDDLDAQFLNFKAEAYEVTREVEFDFSETDPKGLNPPDWGDSTVGGTYHETLTGLHRYPIFVSGTFRLQRVSAVSVLNQ